MIELRRVSFAYPQRPVLTEVSAVLAEQRIGIVGGNGSGKSTLARLINGLVRPTGGQVLVDGLDTHRDLKQVRRRVGFVFQDPDLQIVMPTVAEDLAFSLRPRKLPADQVRQRVEQTLAAYGLQEHADHPAHLLSGGQKQLLALAAVLITEPAIMVLDEPTTLLDLRNRRAVMRVVAGLPQQVVLVTHDLDVLADFDRVLVIDEGRIVADDTPGPALAAYRRLAEV
ncbi:energy-coupling factor ABC transporter ATP-binding protein [Granulicoccus phenolivorans]|uniref:energy-coupling factor ABC transporter ATP-binding protein n=1 Tax=Granulicoccus phenolivorans TaxID=266854 RepID=UPI0004014692|nr:ABC transporter ATP-binding protein [Granulicoccus phenolivorans]